MMVIEFERGDRIQVTQSWQLDELLDDLDSKNNSFFILTAPNGHFLQAAIGGKGHIIEKQLGSLSKHYRATRNGRHDRFSLDDVKAAGRAFFEHQSGDAGVDWEECDPKQESQRLSTDDLEYFVQTYGDNRAARLMWYQRRLENIMVPLLALGLFIAIVLSLASKFTSSS